MLPIRMAQPLCHTKKSPNLSIAVRTHSRFGRRILLRSCDHFHRNSMPKDTLHSATKYN